MEKQNNSKSEKTETIKESPMSGIISKDSALQRRAGTLKVVVPLIFVVICAIIMSVMLSVKHEKSNNIDGRFVLSTDYEGAYLEMDSNGKYELYDSGKKTTGKWSLDGNNLTFEDDEFTFEGKLLDRKYIFFYDAGFFKGDIPEGSEFDAEVTGADGTMYGFSKDGKVYLVTDGASTEIGNYIADGNFIIVTTKDENITYLNCGDGITSNFYQAE